MRAPLRILVNVASLSIFILAANELAKADWSGALDSLSDLKALDLALATVCIIASFFVFSLYDYLAWRWQGGTMPKLRTTLSVSFIATCVSMNIGVSALSGSAIRAKLYGDHGFTLGTIALVYIRTVLLFLLGWAVWLGVALWASRDHISRQTGIPHALLQISGHVSIFALFTYLFICYKGITIQVAKFRVTAPSIQFAFAHLAVSAIDILTSTGVLHALLPTDSESFVDSAAVFMIANTAGMASQIPGGLGVFEWTAMHLSNATKDQTLSALLAFRFLFYWSPLVVALPFAILHYRKRHAL